MKKKLTPNMENYLETILELEDEHGHAHVRDIARKIGIKMPSVTQALGRLKRLKLVNYGRYGAVTLAARGRAIAGRFRRDHQVLARFFREVLKVSSAVAEADACRIEHVISRQSLRRIKELTFSAKT